MSVLGVYLDETVADEECIMVLSASRSLKSQHVTSLQTKNSSANSSAAQALAGASGIKIVHQRDDQDVRRLRLAICREAPERDIEAVG